MCGFNYRFLPAVALARNIINKNLLGKIFGIIIILTIFIIAAIPQLAMFLPNVYIRH